jgi:hypothetical protein
MGEGQCRASAAIPTTSPAGQSAGGAMVVNLLGACRGLWQATLNPALLALRPRSPKSRKGVEVATALGLGDNATAAQLRAVSAQTLANNRRRGSFGAPVDGNFKTTATVDALNAGTEIDVPVMIGLTPARRLQRCAHHRAAGRRHGRRHGSTTSPMSRASGKTNGRPARSIRRDVFALTRSRHRAGRRPRLERTRRRPRRA